MPDFLPRQTAVRLIAALALLVFVGVAPVVAQLPQARVYAIDPPGAQVGTVTEVTISRGDDLDEADALLFSHPGIFASPVMQETPAGPEPVGNRFRVAVAADVPPGRYEVRAKGIFGVSNPRSFMIGARPEARENEPNQPAEQASVVALDSVVNGFINGAGDVDLFRFTATAGQRIVFDCQAQRIDSRLDPTLTLMDSAGRPIKFAENAYHQDDLLVFDVPADGEYLLEVRDVAFTGSADHVYRLAIHTGPHIRFTMPAAGQAGATGKFTLYGFNLPGSERTGEISAGAPLERLEVDIAVPSLPVAETSLAGIPSYAAGLDLFPYRLSTDRGVSNTVLLGVGQASPTTEQEPENNAVLGQKIAVPADVTGRFAEVKDVDVYALDARQDEEFVIEVIGQRRGVPIDPVLIVEQVTVDEQGNEQVKQLTSQDDVTTNLAANIFDTATDDPVFRFKAPAAGTFRVTVRDRAYEHVGGADLAYRLIVRHPQPDFRLVAVPAGTVAGQTWPISLRQGDHFAIDILAFRQDGFAGPIDVSAAQLPYGLEISALTIGSNENTGTLIVTASADATGSPGELRLEGAASVDTPSGQQLVRHPVRAGIVTWNRADPVPAVSRLTDSLTVGVMPEPAPYLVTHEVPQIEVHQGRQILVPLTLASPLENDLVLKLSELPKDSKIQATDVTISKGQSSQTMRVFISPDTPARTYILQLTGQVQLPYRRNPAKVARLEAARSRVIAQEQPLKALLDQATAQANAVAAQLQQAAEQHQQGQAAVTAAEQKLAEANTLAAQAQSAVDAATGAVQIAEAQATKAAADAEAAQQAAASTEDEALKTQAAEARQAAATAAQTLAAAKTAAEQARAQQEAAAVQVKQATDELAAAREPLAKLQAAEQALQAEKQRADQLVAARTAAWTPVDQARQAAEKAAADAAKAAEPKNLNVTQPVPPIAIAVKPAPVKLDVKLSAAEVKRGTSIEATVTITRQNEFAGPVNLSLPTPSGESGVVAAEFTVPADSSTGVFKFTVAADAAPGEIPHLVIRAVADHGGPAIVEAPITVKVVE